MADAVVGDIPSMEVSRKIKRSFTADWTATVRMVEHLANGKSGFVTVCTAFGKNDYLASATLPARLDLKWWTWPRECNLDPGQYVLTTVWHMDVPGLWPREIRTASNPFRIRETKIEENLQP